MQAGKKPFAVKIKRRTHNIYQVYIYIHIWGRDYRSRLRKYVYEELCGAREPEEKENVA